MIYLYVLFLVLLTTIGYFFEKIIHKKGFLVILNLKSITTNRSGIQLLESAFNDNPTINILKQGVGLGGDYYDPSENAFYISNETAIEKNGASVSIVIYLSALKNINSKKIKMLSSILLLDSSFSLLIFIFAIIALFTKNITFVYISVGCLILTLVIDIFKNYSQYSIGNKNIKQLVSQFNISLEQIEIDSAIKYFKIRKLQSIIMFLFNPLIFNYYYFRLFFKHK